MQNLVTPAIVVAVLGFLAKIFDSCMSRWERQNAKDRDENIKLTARNDFLEQQNSSLTRELVRRDLKDIERK